MISVEDFSEEKAWSKKLRKKEIFFKEICNFHSALATLFRVQFGSFDGSFADSEEVLKVGSKNSNDTISKIHFKVAIQRKSCKSV